MQLFSELQRVAKSLEVWRGYWALCGGVVASVYRDTPRFTGDIDVAVVDSPAVSASSIAESALREMNYSPIFGFVPDPKGTGEQKRALICGRGTHNDRFTGVDFLLPEFPWLVKAVERGQSNLVDFGFGELPTITPEDLVLAKINAIQSRTPRAQDLDDLQALSSSSLPLDVSYIAREARVLGFVVPEWLSAIRNKM